LGTPARPPRSVSHSLDGGRTIKTAPAASRALIGWATLAGGSSGGSETRGHEPRRLRCRPGHQARLAEPLEPQARAAVAGVPLALAPLILQRIRLAEIADGGKRANPNRDCRPHTVGDGRQWRSPSLSSRLWGFRPARRLFQRRSAARPGRRASP